MRIVVAFAHGKCPFFSVKNNTRIAWCINDNKFAYIANKFTLSLNCSTGPNLAWTQRLSYKQPFCWKIPTIFWWIFTARVKQQIVRLVLVIRNVVFTSFCHLLVNKINDNNMVIKWLKLALCARSRKSRKSFGPYVKAFVIRSEKFPGFRQTQVRLLKRVNNLQ